MNDKNDILFSIIIPTFNRGHMINHAIESVINQEYTNWELIIVDDGSIDNTSKIVLTFDDKRIKYIYQENKGRSVARNLGIDKSKGSYLSFLDDDDYYYSDFLSKFHKKIVDEACPVGVFMCDQDEENEGETFAEVEKKTNYHNNPGKFVLCYSNNFQPFCTSKEILMLEKFDSRFELGEDFHLMFRIVLKYPFYYIPKILCVYKNHTEMTVVNELDGDLFLQLKYNRIDSLEDLDQKLGTLINKHKLRGDFNKKFNKIAYFYASKAMKTCRSKISLHYLLKMKRSKLSFKMVYYLLSISFRIFFYFIKCLFSKS